MNSRSRLTRRLEKQSRKQMTLFIIGTLVILVLIIKFGLFVVTTLGSGVVKINELTSKDATQSRTTNEVLMPPVLDTLPQAIKDSNIKISGKSIEKNGEIELFINNDLDSTTQIEDDGGFSFENITLKEGDNYIKVRLKNEKDKTSKFSKEYKVTYKKKEPKLEINSPSDNQSFSKDNQEINIQGKTDTDNQVTVNGFWAIVDSEGNFSYTFRMNNGDNNLTVEATDPAGNVIKKELKVNYNP